LRGKGEKKKKKKKTEKWGRGMNCEEEMRVKNEMGEVRGMYVSGGGEVKRKGGGTWVVGERKGKKKEKINEEVWYVGGDSGEGKKERN
jgi:hypothetical protein